MAVILTNAFLLLATHGFFILAACNSLNALLEPHEKELGGFVMSVVINTTIGLANMVSLVAFSHLFAF